jgi:hypothetical protein
VGENADEAVAGFSYSQGDDDVVTEPLPPSAEELTFISPRKGGPLPLTRETTPTIRFFWVKGNSKGLPEYVKCDIYDSQGNPTKWKSATGLMTVSKPELMPGGLTVFNNSVRITDEGALYYGVNTTPSNWYEHPSSYCGESAIAQCSGKGDDRYFWAQLLTSGSVAETDEGKNKKPVTLWSVNVPTLDTFWPSTDNKFLHNLSLQARLYSSTLMDSPSSPTPGRHTEAIGVYMQFRSWFMYQPEPGDDGPFTIPVPIMSFGWSWMADERKDQDGHWKLTDVNTWPDFGEVDSTLQYPKWNQVCRGQLVDEGDYRPGSFIVTYP